MTQIESIVEPDCITDDIGREPVTFVGIHGPILANSTRSVVSTVHSACGRSGRDGDPKLLNLIGRVELAGID